VRENATEEVVVQATVLLLSNEAATAWGWEGCTQTHWTLDFRRGGFRPILKA
jgi:hypothetical protein